MSAYPGIEKTVRWLADRTAEARADGLVVGVSGGVDSAVVAFLIKKAMADHSLGVILPCESSMEDIDDARKVVAACGIEAVEIDLSAFHQDLAEKILEKADGIKGTDSSRLKIAKANLKARLRMSALYTVANALNYLVVGTDNAAETYVGYFTKYGDGGVDLLPIKHLRKRDVREWAKVLGVPKRVIEKAPTAGLWEGQTDEGEMGTTYDMVDDLLEGKTIPERDRKIIERLHRVSEHKRNLPAGPPREWFI